MGIKTFIDKKSIIVNPEAVSYVGIFFDKKSICDLAVYGHRLDKIIENPHITLAYRPKPEQLKQFVDFMSAHPNAEITANISRYGNDGKNEGFYVSSITCSDRVTVPYFGANQKHITISVSNDSSPVKTGTMNFNQEVGPITVWGNIGIFMKDKTIVSSPVSVEFGFHKDDIDR